MATKSAMAAVFKSALRYGQSKIKSPASSVSGFEGPSNGSGIQIVREKATGPDTIFFLISSLTRNPKALRCTPNPK